MGLRPLIFYISFSAGTVFRRQILTSKDGPRAERVTFTVQKRHYGDFIFQELNVSLHVALKNMKYIAIRWIMCHFALYDTPCGQRGWVVYIMVFLICTFCVVCHAQWTARLSCHYCGVSYVHFVLYVTSSGQRGWVVIIMVFPLYILCCMSRPVDSAVELSLLWCFLCTFCVVCHVQ